ncbi:ribonuclease H-like domain-containing protein [Tanacetum coccineum]
MGNGTSSHYLRLIRSSDELSDTDVGRVVTFLDFVATLSLKDILEFVHDGDKSVSELMDIGRQLLGRRQVLPTVPHLLDSVQVLFIEKKKIMASHDQQWYMDTGATSHLSSHTGNLQTSSLNRNFNSVIVGNGSFIPVTHSGHLQIPNPYRPLHLKNVLVTPNIIKNLVSVRKFTTDNKCSIDFDTYGFTVRDYHTRQTLLRCDSTGDLYPLHVAASAFALLTNNHSLWHQRLGHPGDNVIQTLSSRDPNWKQAMCDEYKALIDNKTWALVPRPPNVNIVRSMWLYKHKYNVDGSLSRYKARLVVNGRSQQQDIDCDETFSPVVKLATIRTVLSLAVSRQWSIHQLDVKKCISSRSSYRDTLHASANTDSAHSDYVCLLQKLLYGLKKAPRAWFQRFSSYAIRAGFYHSKTDSSLFIFHKGPDTAYLLLYVDDIILTASSTSLLQRIISSLHAEFAMINLCPLNYFLGISATRTTSGIFLSQKKYATEILKQAHMLNCNPCRTRVDTEKKLGPEGSPITDPTLYRSLAGSLQYLTFTGPDLSYAVQYDNLLTWSFKRQDTLSRSSAEAEYRGVANAVAETSWIRNLLRELHTPLSTATLVYCDNVSAVYMSANPEQHQRTKHIEIDIHFVRDKVAAGTFPDDTKLITVHDQISSENGNLELALHGSFLLRNLSFLRELSLSNKTFQGTIPHELGHLSRLRRLYLDEYKFSGVIPTNLSGCYNLEVLWLGQNKLAGGIPKQISLCSKLTILVTDENKLTGGIPPFLGNITSMEVFTAVKNPLGGRIPDTLGHWKSLTVFDSGDSNLYGSIPHSIFNLSLLVNFSLPDNRLTGSLPSEIGNQLPNLELLQLRDNELTGILPPTISNCSQLRVLEMGGNNFSGKLTIDFSKLRDIKIIELAENNFHGRGEADDMRSVSDINSLSGSIPSEIKDLKMLNILDLSHNNLSGNITNSLGGLEGEVPVVGVFANASAFSVLGNNRLCGGLVTLELPKCKEKGSKKKRFPLFVLAILITPVLLVVLCCVHLLCKKKRDSQPSQSLGNERFLRVSYNELFKATDGFSTENLIGEGGFSSYTNVLHLSEYAKELRKVFWQHVNPWQFNIRPTRQSVQMDQCVPPIGFIQGLARLLGADLNHDKQLKGVKGQQLVTAILRRDDGPSRLGDILPVLDIVTEVMTGKTIRQDAYFNEGPLAFINLLSPRLYPDHVIDIMHDNGR